jgi:hypothetical protein
MVVLPLIGNQTKNFEYLVNIRHSQQPCSYQWNEMLVYLENKVEKNKGKLL